MNILSENMLFAIWVTTVRTSHRLYCSLTFLFICLSCLPATWTSVYTHALVRAGKQTATAACVFGCVWAYSVQCCASLQHVLWVCVISSTFCTFCHLIPSHILANMYFCMCPLKAHVMCVWSHPDAKKGSYLIPSHILPSLRRCLYVYVKSSLSSPGAQDQLVRASRIYLSSRFFPERKNGGKRKEGYCFC